ncbi:polymorphic toxin-type HINT domain-containing protein [Deinococcus sp. JMULE3]|uniref:polymorphic toxin-type HINT domain-containing protein n=1 Tax=Deinococcus sp. JMULE3 TaxID=2518341 RepID=UPI0015763500|nr:polymorphic toxin-type HINT domain-containing protein [Deinococcus sp. JMULE3]
MRIPSSSSPPRQPRWVGATLATLFLTTTHLPGVVALAAPQLFTRPGSGVSNIPTELAAFAAPQFGDIADAVNAATGNVYFDLGSINRNNVSKPGDDTVSTTGGFRVNGLMRLSGFSPTMNPATIPQEWSVAQGDGSFDLYRRASSAEIDAAPTWINERYASIRGGVAFYIRKTQTGLQTDEQWLVTFQLANSRLISHLYDRAGNRTTFYNDGEYPDYTQTLHQQYRTAKYRNDAEGIDPTAPKTEFTYTAPGNGHLSKVKDEWGRVTTYEWNDALNRLDAVNMLVQDEANPIGSWKRRIEYAYEQRGGQYYVTYMVHRTYDATGNLIGRWFDLNYTEQNGQVLLYQMGRPRAVDQSDTSQLGMVYTTYTYDGSNRVSTVKTPGEADISFTYGTSTTAGALGQQVVRTQGDKKLTLEYTPEGWLRYQRERDYNSVIPSDRTLSTTYWYDAAGRIRAINLPSGAQIQNVYDNHGNKTRETVYVKAVNWASTPPAGYERTTQYEYNRDNQVTNTIQEARSGTVVHGVDSTQTATFSYGAVTRPVTRANYSVYSYNQKFAAPSSATENVNVDGVNTSATINTVDEYGRLTRTQSVAAGTPTVNTDYEYHSGTAQIWQPTVTGDIDWSRPRGVRNFGDQVHLTWTYQDGQARDSGKRTQTYYDEFGNPAWVNLEKWTGGKWTAGTAVQRDLQQFAAYNGFGQQEWAYSRTLVNGSTDAKEESKSLTKFFTSGEPKFSFTGNPGNLTTFAYNATGQLIELKMGAGANGAITTPRRTTAYTYDGYGRKASETTSGNSTTFEYDTRDNLARQVNPDSSTIVMQYNSLTGALAHEQVSRAGEPLRYTKHTLDALGREIRTTSNTSVGDKIVDTLYDAYDRPIRVTNQALTMNADPKDRSTYLRYDTLGRLVKKLDPALITNGSPYTDARRPYTEYGYDWRGRQTTVTSLLYGGTVTPDTMTFPQGAALAGETTEYDLFDRPVKVTDAAGYTTSMTYDRAGNVTTLTKQVWRGDETDYTVAAPGFTSTTTRMAYTAAQKPTQMVDARGNSIYTDYDINGNVTLSTDARGIVTKAFTYTSDNLLERVWEPDNNAGTTAKYGEVSLGSLSSTHQVTEYNQYGVDGSLKPVTTWRAHMNTQAGPNSGARTDYVYDYAGRVTSTTLPADAQGATATITQDYDSLGNVTKTVDANGFPTVNTYNEDGKLASTHQQARAGNATDSGAGLSNGLRSTYRYDLNGNLTYKNERNLITEYRYNSLGKVVHESRPRVGDATATNWKLTTYRLDGLPTVKTSYTYAGNLTSQPQTVVPGDSSLAVTAGNATITEYNARGDVWAEWSLAAGRTPESQFWQYVNGAGQRYRRVFLGNMGIYAEQKANEVTPLGHANSLTFWRFDELGNLLEKWDTPMNNSTWTASNLADRQNWFRYTYSASGKQLTEARKIEVRQKSVRPTNELNKYGGYNGIYLAASISNSSSSYNERDQISAVSIADRSPILSNDRIPMQDSIDSAPVINQSYTYYLDGKLRNENGKVFEMYDQRGRQLKVLDPNGAASSAECQPQTVNGTTKPSDNVVCRPGYIEYYYDAEKIITNIYHLKSDGTASDTSRNTVYTSVGGNVAKRVKSKVRAATLYFLDSTHVYKYDSLTGLIISSSGDNSSQINTYNQYGQIDSTTTKSDNKYTKIFYSYDGDGYMKSSGFPLSSTYRIDSRGNRLSELSDGITTWQKRYNADNKVHQFNSNEYYSPAVNSMHSARLNDFRYSPNGGLAITSTAQIIEGSQLISASDDPIFSVIRDWSNSFSSNDSITAIYRKAGDFRRWCEEDDSGQVLHCDIIASTYKTNAYQYKDALYSEIDGTHDTISWNGTTPFSIVRIIDTFDAPIKPLSGILKIDPLNITNQKLPKLIDPSKVKPGLDSQDQSETVKPVQTGASQGAKQTVQISDGQARAQATKASDSGAVMVQEVPADFDDGQGFEQPIYAVQPQVASVADYISQAGGDVLRGLQAYNKARQAEIDAELGRQKKLAQDQKEMLSNEIDKTFFRSSSGYDVTEKLRRGLQNSLEFAEKTMNPTEQLAYYAGLSLMLGQDNISNNKGLRIVGHDTSDALSAMGNAVEQLGSRQAKPVKESLLATVTAAYAMDAYKKELGSFAFTVLTLPADVAAFMKTAKTVGPALARLAKMSPRAVFDITKMGKTAGEIGISGLRRLADGCDLVPNSFSPNTLVRTLSGLVAISALTIGTPVLAFNEQTGQNGYYPITHVITHGTKDQGVTYLTLTDPDNKNKLEFIETTPEHPFFVAQPADAQPRPAPEGHGDLSRNWVGAGHLKIGDKIKQADGTTGLVANVTTVEQTREMFNLTVSEAHTYYVGQDGWLVHNCDDHIVLGLDKWGLGHTANAVGGRTLMSDPNWRATLIEAIADPKTKFTVSIDGMTGKDTYAKIMGAVQRAASGSNEASLTDWEMKLLYEAGRLGEVQFTKLGGRTTLENPFK